MSTDAIAAQGPLDRGVSPRRIETLPKWAQRHIQNLRREIDRRDSLVTAHSLLCEQNRDWFTIRGSKRDGSMKLWLLNHDQPHAVCSIGPDYVLLVARANAEVTGAPPHGA